MLLLIEPNRHRSLTSIFSRPTKTPRPNGLRLDRILPTGRYPFSRAPLHSPDVSRIDHTPPAGFRSMSICACTFGPVNRRRPPVLVDRRYTNDRANSVAVGNGAVEPGLSNDYSRPSTTNITRLLWHS